MINQVCEWMSPQTINCSQKSFLVLSDNIVWKRKGFLKARLSISPYVFLQKFFPYVFQGRYIVLTLGTLSSTCYLSDAGKRLKIKFQFFLFTLFHVLERFCCVRFHDFTVPMLRIINWIKCKLQDENFCFRCQKAFTNFWDSDCLGSVFDERIQ